MMMNNVAMKFAASTLVVALTMVACKPAAEASRPRSASHRAAKADQDSSRLVAKARAAAQKGSNAEALKLAEQAVEASPRDAGYRMLLGDLYLKNGRFNSAETSFADVLALDPANTRAALSIALAQIALGKTGDALSRLEQLATVAPAADLGLAFALAGQQQRAVEMLEPAARADGADGRVRQNLALAYALAGDWEKARVTAAQDVSPAELPGRLQQWAAFARPSSPWQQVASLLGVTAVEDAGQPVALALAPVVTEAPAYAAAEAAPEASAYAAAAEIAPEPAPVIETSATYQSQSFAYTPAPATEAPVELAQAELPKWVPAEAAPVEAVPSIPEQVAQIEETPAAEPEQVKPEPSFVRAVQALVTPDRSVIRVPARIAATPHTFRAAPLVRPRLAKAASVGNGSGRYVVQIGAFSSLANVERAWAGAYRRYGFGDHQPRSTTIHVAGKGLLHRLSVSGFSSHGDAAGMCQSIRAKGGVCFVRAAAGDAPVRWASRYTSRRNA